MKFEGIVTHISDEIELKIGNNTSSKKVVCLTERTDREYPEKLAIDFIGAKADIILQEWIGIGDFVAIKFNTNYNRYPGKDGKPEVIYNSVKGRDIEVIEKAVKSGVTQSGGHTYSKPVPADDDLPF